MPDTIDEAKWRAEFDEIGEKEVLIKLKNRALMNYEPKIQCAYRWLQDQENTRKLRERKLYWYTQWTFWAAIAAAFISAIGIVVTWLH